MLRTWTKCNLFGAKDGGFGGSASDVLMLLWNPDFNDSCGGVTFHGYILLD